MGRAPASITGVILAGGQSRRMGRDKALLDLGGRPMIARVAERLGQACAEVLVVDREPGRYAFLGLPVVPDRRPGFGALSGLHAGLLALRRPFGLFVACDMPFLRPPLLRYLAALATTAAAAAWDAVVPRRGGRPEPLLAVYGRHLLPVVEDILAGGGGPLRRVLEAPGVRVRWVEEQALRRFDPELVSLVNVNTPEDYRQALRRWTP